jgi:hypothetical protein
MAVAGNNGLARSRRRRPRYDGNGGGGCNIRRSRGGQGYARTGGVRCTGSDVIAITVYIEAAPKQGRMQLSMR